MLVRVGTDGRCVWGSDDFGIMWVSCLWGSALLWVGLGGCGRWCQWWWFPLPLQTPTQAEQLAHTFHAVSGRERAFHAWLNTLRDILASASGDGCASCAYIARIRHSSPGYLRNPSLTFKHGAMKPVQTSASTSSILPEAGPGSCKVIFGNLEMSNQSQLEIVALHFLGGRHDALIIPSANMARTNWESLKKHVFCEQLKLNLQGFATSQMGITTAGPSDAAKNCKRPTRYGVQINLI